MIQDLGKVTVSSISNVKLLASSFDKATEAYEELDSKSQVCWT